MLDERRGRCRVAATSRGGTCGQGLAARPDAHGARAQRPPRPDDVHVPTCQKWEEGFYNAYAHMAEEELDLVVFLGDYTYEYGIDPATAASGASSCRRSTPTRPSRSTSSGCATRSTRPTATWTAHARFPFVVTWDDHEVDNDYTGDIPEDGTPPEVFHVRRIAGYQAFYEHLPLRAPGLPIGAGSRGSTVRSPGGRWPSSSSASSPRPPAALVRSGGGGRPPARDVDADPDRAGSPGGDAGGPAAPPRPRHRPGDGKVKSDGVIPLRSKQSAFVRRQHHAPVPDAVNQHQRPHRTSSPPG